MIGALFALLLALAQQSETLRAAEAAYRAGRFAEAKLRCELALADPSLAPGPVLFNLGNCAYRLGRPAEALWQYRRARLHLPRDAALRANLALAERQLGLRAEQPDSIGSSIAGAIAGLTRRERLWLASLAQAAGCSACSRCAGAACASPRWWSRCSV
jgi:Tfp pilus assembly protein PilF